jgi:Lytic polysaccharide mono-oxygenase, cellulose-degrading
MQISLLYVFLAGLGATPRALAHIILAAPVPYGSPNSDPLQASGSDYPCKLKTIGGWNATTVQTIQSGQTLHVAFTGTAVHGGGSCQFSLTKDRQPSANSQFKVFYSIEGGCPGTNSATTTYDITIPPEVPAGDYSFAWTWYNNVGNRELYMGCSPITVAGGSGTDQTFASLVDMTLFNVGTGATCKTQDSKDLQFPNPGKYLSVGAGANLAIPTGSCPTGTGAPSSGSSGSGSGSSAPAPAGTSSANVGAYSAPANPGIPSSSTAATTMMTLTTASAAASSPSAAPYTNSSAPAPAGMGAPVAAGDVPCSSNDALVCSSDGTKFGLCNFGSAVMQPVAAGTTCQNGAILRRSVRFHRRGGN